MNSDFRDLLAEFNAHAVEYIVVGAHALAVHGHVRATKDLDVWVRPTPENADRTWRALAAFGAPLAELTATDLAMPGVVYQVGVPPVRIDIVTAISGVQFDDAWADRIDALFGDVRAPVLSRRWLLTNKKATGRLQDLADIEWLESHPHSASD